MLTGIAWRNIWRNKKRSAVILIAIALGLSGGLFAVGIMIGMADSMVNTAVDSDLAHIQIHTRAFKDDPDINNYIPEADSIALHLRSFPEVRGISCRSVLEGMASSPATNSGVRITGIDPSAEFLVTNVSEKITEGKYLDTAGRNEIIAGKKLIEKLNLRLHSKIVLSFPGSDGSIIYGAFRITGIFETGSTMFDKSVVFVRNKDIARLLGSDRFIHEIAVRLTGAKAVQNILAKIKEQYPDLIVESWKDLAPELKITAEMTDISMLFFLSIILFALLFGITNTMLMSVLDRVREFGMLMAIGMKRKKIFSQIILETLFLSLSGSAAGIAAGAAIIKITEHTGINLSVFAEGLSLYGISPVLYPSVPSEIYAELAVLVFITALAAAVYPGMKATRLNPADSIRTYG
jgi:putative ABC transport system permease protein